MKYFFDESGSFTVTEAGEHILVGMMYPEVYENNLFHFYNSFVSSLHESEFKRNEPKGSALSVNSRKKLLHYLQDNIWLKIGVFITDSAFNTEAQINNYRIEKIKICQEQLKNLNEITHNEEYNWIKEILYLFKSDDDLSNVEIHKGNLLINAIASLFIHSLNYYKANVYDEDWKNIIFCFDRLNKNIITKMEKWVEMDTGSIIMNLSLQNTKILDSRIYLKEHPLYSFVDLDENAINLTNLFKNSFLFESSDKSPQLQIVDWISNTIYKVIKEKFDFSFWDGLKNNLVYHNSSKAHVVYFYDTDKSLLYNKYKRFLM